MAEIEKTLVVDVPLRTAYDQWTQFESFPEFMENVEQVVQEDDTTLDWTAKVAGKEKHWTAKITEQIPDQRIAWQSVTGAPNGGVVMFESLGADRTRIELQLEAEPEGAVESAGEAMGFLGREVKGDLERFKDFVEQHGQTGGWRGEVVGGQETNR